MQYSSPEYFVSRPHSSIASIAPPEGLAVDRVPVAGAEAAAAEGGASVPADGVLVGAGVVFAGAAGVVATVGGAELGTFIGTFALPVAVVAAVLAGTVLGEVFGTTEGAPASPACSVFVALSSPQAPAAQRIERIAMVRISVLQPPQRIGPGRSQVNV
jgi:hypothetical protein